ncbi:MAG: redoxin domain-containing protein [Pseudobdellovibrionaceae bacterium]
MKRLGLMSFYLVLGFLSFFFSLAGASANAPISQIEGFDLISGKNFKFALSELSSSQKGIVLVFLSAVCPCSDSHISEMKRLAEKFGEFKFIAVHSNQNEKKEIAKAYFNKAALPFPVLSDHGAKIADSYRANKTPHAYVIDGQGKIVYQGGVTSSAVADQADQFYLEEALLDIRRGAAVKIPFGRTLGCVISRSKE